MIRRALSCACLLALGLVPAAGAAVPVAPPASAAPGPARPAPAQTQASPALLVVPPQPTPVAERPAAAARWGATPRATWVFQGATGTAFQLHSRLVIEQDEEDDLDFTAAYETRPFTSGAPYYSFRLGRWLGKTAWEFETHHHLVTLVDGPPEVGSFSITHGYNLNTVNRAWLARGLVWRLGAGVVITHPESVVRGRTYSGDGFANGFSLSGFCGQAALEKRLPLGKNLFLYVEGKATAAWARVPIADGTATVPNYALHALAGAGFSF